jgi:hypothetical protein
VVGKFRMLCKWFLDLNAEVMFKITGSEVCVV